MSWITNNFSTIVICAVLVVIVAGIVRNMIKNKRQGKSSCGCGCESCAMKGSCHGKNE